MVLAVLAPPKPAVLTSMSPLEVLKEMVVAERAVPERSISLLLVKFNMSETFAVFGERLRAEAEELLI